MTESAAAHGELPRLGAKEIEKHLELLLEKRRNHYLFAFYGTGQSASITAGNRDFEVVAVASELELRQRMPDIDAAEPQRVFLLPFEELPLDLRGLFALQRVVRIGRAERIQSLLGVRSVDADAARSALGDAILTGATALRSGSVEGRLTKEALFEAWFAQRWGAPRGNEFGRDALLAWAADNGRGSELAELGARLPALLDEMRRELARRLGPIGGLTLDAWMKGEGARLIELGVLAEAARPLIGGVAWVHLRQRIASFGVATKDAEPVLQQLGQSVGHALSLIDLRSDTRTRQLLEAADKSVDDPEVRAHMASGNSVRLRMGFEHLERVLTEALVVGDGVLEGGQERPIQEAVLAAIEAHQALSRHALAVHAPWTDRAREAVRLLGWLANHQRALSKGGALHDDPATELGRIARWYAEEGGYVDLSRHRAWGPPVSPLDTAVTALRERADRARRALDLRFVRAMREWVQAGRPAKEVLPIEEALAKIAVPFLEESEDRRLLVLLLDGMAWSQAVELLDSLRRFDDGWAPIQFNRRRTAESELPVVFAALPTVTEVSRSAFFAGKRMDAGKEHDTQDDPKRLAQHRGLKPFFSGTTIPRLFLRADAQVKAGSVSEALLTEVRDPSIRLTAAVFNTIDDSLKNNPSQQQRWTVDTIGPLRDLLLAAKRAGRHVMIASDHGHVPSDGLRNLGMPTKGEGRRWRMHREGETTVGPEEVMIGPKGAWLPKGADGVILLSDDSARYGASTASGEHGGASLAEVLAPCAILGWDELGESQGSLSLLARYEPAWYRLEAVTDGATPPRVRKRPDSKQLKLLAIAAPEPEPEPEKPAKAATEIRSPLRKSELLTQQIPDAGERDKTIRALLFVKGRGNTVSADAFAQHMGYLPHRAAGLVAFLAERLSMDGMQPLVFDPRGRLIKLDLKLFVMLYGTEP